MRSVLALCALALGLGAARADDPKLTPASPTPTIESRIATLEAEVCRLKKELAAAKAPPKGTPAKLPCACADACGCPASECPSKCPVTQTSAHLVVYPHVKHVSPDGTPNELWSDGVFRAIPGAPACPNGKCNLR